MRDHIVGGNYITAASRIDISAETHVFGSRPLPARAYFHDGERPTVSVVISYMAGSQVRSAVGLQLRAQFGICVVLPSG